jgi:hypothetical protein
MDLSGPRLHHLQTKHLSSTSLPVECRNKWNLTFCFTEALIAMNGLPRVSIAELTTADRPCHWWRLHRQGDAAGASLVSHGTRLLMITNKMSMLSSSHSTQTLTILSLIRQRLSTAVVIEAFALVTVNCRVELSPIMRRVMVARQLLIIKYLISSLKKMGLAHLQGLRG